MNLPQEKEGESDKKPTVIVSFNLHTLFWVGVIPFWQRAKLRQKSLSNCSMLLVSTPVSVIFKLPFCLSSYHIHCINGVSTMTLEFFKDNIKRSTKGPPRCFVFSFKLSDAAAVHRLRGHFSEQHHNRTQHLSQGVFSLQFVAIN